MASDNDILEEVQAMSTEEVDAELRAAGLDPTRVASRIALRVCERLGPDVSPSLMRMAMRYPGWVAQEGEA